MQLNVAHVRERSTTGGWIDFAVFDAKSTAGTDSANDALLVQPTQAAREVGLKVDMAALAYRQGNRNRFYGSEDIVDYLVKRGVPRCTRKTRV